MAQHQECDTDDEGDDQPEDHREDDVEYHLIIFEDLLYVTIAQLSVHGVDKRKGPIRYEEHDGEDVE